MICRSMLATLTSTSTAGLLAGAAGQCGSDGHVAEDQGFETEGAHRLMDTTVLLVMDVQRGVVERFAEDPGYLERLSRAITAAPGAGIPAGSGIVAFPPAHPETRAASAPGPGPRRPSRGGRPGPGETPPRPPPPGGPGGAQTPGVGLPGQ